jgi:HEAT repeat protein
MPHWTERIFKDYKSEATAPPHSHGQEQRGRRDFEIAALIAELAHPDALARKRAARAIGLLHDRSGIPALITALSDRDELVRASARESLTSFTLDASEQEAVRRAASAS